MPPTTSVATTETYAPQTTDAHPVFAFDGQDNDCDLLIDGKDPQCGFHILAVAPSFGTDRGERRS